MFKFILRFFKCKHKDKQLVGYSYTTYVNTDTYSGKRISYSTETYRHFICKKCNTHIKETITRYASNKEKEDSDKFENKLKEKGFLGTEDMMLKIDKAIYGEVETTTLIDKNKLY